MGAAVRDLGERPGSACSVTGVLALLLARGVAASAQAVRAELEGLEGMGAIMLEGDEFYITH